MKENLKSYMESLKKRKEKHLFHSIPNAKDHQRIEKEKQEETRSN